MVFIQSVVPLSPNNGLTIPDIVDKAHHGEIKGLMVFGENPMVSDPDRHHVGEALDNLELLIVQDIFLTETAMKAHVVFPGVTFAEKNGTFSNTERRVQRVRQAITPKGDDDLIGIFCGIYPTGWDIL
ncbi:MAG: molybdopterin-dependent oxidoreductase [Parabacteroides sp.]|nr:molybdopterin-dependent oxidoreductase [Parabacteroides sp.]